MRRSRSAVGWDRGFTGYVADNETGLLHARARQYSPTLGRFIGRDRLTRATLFGIGYPQARMGYYDGLNLYGAYLVPNRLDPTGFETFEFPCGTLEITVKPFDAKNGSFTGGVSSDGDGVSVKADFKFTPNGKCCCKFISFVQVITHDDFHPPHLPGNKKVPHVDVGQDETDPYYGAKPDGHGGWGPEDPGVGDSVGTGGCGHNGFGNTPQPAHSFDTPNGAINPLKNQTFTAQVCAICIDNQQVYGCATWGFTMKVGDKGPTPDGPVGSPKPSDDWNNGYNDYNSGRLPPE